MQLDIYADPICPWCFIGKRRLERALILQPRNNLQISWRPFQLNPDMPQEGMDRQTYLSTKFGGAESAKRIYGSIAAAGVDEGIDFQFDSIQRTPNTLNAHHLLKLAQASDLQNAMMESLCRAYFLEGKDIGAEAVLRCCAQDIGLSSAAIDEFFEQKKSGMDVFREDMKARQAGISGVPCYVINGRYALSGAQPPEVLNRMLDIAEAEE